MARKRSSELVIDRVLLVDLDGNGVPPDYVQAHMWFDLAAAHHPATETESRATALKSRDSVAKKMTPAQIAEARRLAREWEPK